MRGTWRVGERPDVYNRQTGEYRVSEGGGTGRVGERPDVYNRQTGEYRVNEAYHRGYHTHTS